MRQLKQYLKQLEYTQPKAIRYMHVVILCLVLLEILLSNIMKVDKSGHLSSDLVQFIGTWAHITIGLSLVCLGPIFIFIVLKIRGVEHFYPYLFRNVGQIKQDIKQLLKLQLPEGKPYGIAACVQGLGLGALCLVFLSGFTWFICWQSGWPIMEQVEGIHKTLTGLLETYVVGHGSFAIIHILLSSNKAA